VCRGEATSLREILDCAAQIAGYPIEVVVNPAFVRANEIPRLLGNNQRLQEAIGFVPEIGMGQTLRDMMEV
jgi:nucleoside-diphosphate-sugar epimerase